MALINQFSAGLAEGNLPPLGLWSYLFLACLVAVEGPVITGLAAVIAATGAMNPLGVFAAASLGNAGADAGWYLLGYLGRFEVLTARFKWLGQHTTSIKRLEAEIHQHALKILLLAKLTLSLSVPALIAAGMARVPPSRWLPGLLVGELIWTGSLVLVGYYLTEQIRQLERGLHLLAAVSLVVLLGLGLWLIRRLLHSTAGPGVDQGR